MHAPARRPCRLEHEARQRALGADVSEREVRLEQDRLRSLLGARPRSRETRHRRRDARQRLSDRRGRTGSDGRRHRDDRGASLAHTRARPFAGPCADQPHLTGETGLLLGRHHSPRDPDLSSVLEQLCLCRTSRRRGSRGAWRWKNAPAPARSCCRSTSAHRTFVTSTRRARASRRASSKPRNYSGPYSRSTPAARQPRAASRDRRRSSRSGWRRRTGCRPTV